MRSKVRYSLILFGLLVFGILAPTLVRYVRGLSYNPEQAAYIQTGIFTVRTDPSNAQLSLNGTLKDSTPATIRFLEPKDYLISIEKPEYAAWRKTLPVKADRVTTGQSDRDTLYLLLDKPRQQTLSDGVLAFAAGADTLYALTSRQLVLIPRADLNRTTNIALPKPVNQIQQAPGGELALLSQGATRLLFDHNQNSFTDISNLMGANAHIQFGQRNQLLSLDEQILYEIDWRNKQKLILKTGVLGFTTLEDDLYYISGTTTASQLQLARLDQLTNPETTVAQNLPRLIKPELVVTNQKAIFIKDHETVYKVNAQLERVADNISAWHFDVHRQNLSFKTPSELYFYNNSTQAAQLITRSNGPIDHFMVNATIGYAFAIQQLALRALELDTRDHQNTYMMTDTSGEAQFWLDNDDETIYLLDNGQLSQLTIR